MMHARLPVAVIGAGPVGLAAAAHLLARGELPLILEAGPATGHAVRQWGHVRMFTPWRFCVDRQAAAQLTVPLAALLLSGTLTGLSCLALLLLQATAQPGAAKPTLT